MSTTPTDDYVDLKEAAAELDNEPIEPVQYAPQYTGADIVEALDRLTAAVQALPGALLAAYVNPRPAVAPTVAPQQLAGTAPAVQVPPPNLGPQQGVSWGGTQPTNTNWVCPVHGAMKVVPAGVSQRTGKPYQAFVACPERGCSEKPPRTA